MTFSVLLLHGVGSSAMTWWRALQDLTDLGVSATVLDLAGHGQRAVPPGGLTSLTDLAEDVLVRTGGRHFDVVLGHSLGAVVALTLVRAHPDTARLVILEDPPALGGSFTTSEVADDLEASARRVRTDPSAETRAILAANPRWSSLDAASTVASRLEVDAPAVTTWLRAAHWDLPALVRDCPRPVCLIAADGPETALVEPGRAAVLAELPAEQVVVVPGGHGLHRDRPALWLHAVFGFVGELGPTDLG